MGCLYIDILESLLNTFEYDYLRTERTLGYIVFAMEILVYNSVGYTVNIQSKFSPPVLDMHISESLVEFRSKMLLNLT